MLTWPQNTKTPHPLTRDEGLTRGATQIGHNKQPGFSGTGLASDTCFPVTVKDSGSAYPDQTARAAFHRSIRHAEQCQTHTTIGSLRLSSMCTLPDH